jgi:hypothetical protein
MECWCCNKEATERHHILPRRYGGLDENNVVNLCSECHDVIDRKGEPNLKVAERMNEYPKLQHLATCRLMCEYYNQKALFRIFENTIFLFIEAFENKQPIDKFRKAFFYLKKRCSFTSEKQ